jgi:signal transduction histidine kinase
VIRRLVTTYLALTLVVLAALEIPLALTYRDRQLDQLESALERDAFVIASYVEDSLNGSDPSLDLQTFAENYRGAYAGRVVIVDRNGDVVGDSSPQLDPVTGQPVGGRNFLSRPEFFAAITDRDVSTGTRDSVTLGTGLVYVAVPVSSPDDVYGAVRVSYSTDQLDARVHRYWMLLAGAALVTLAAAGGLGILLARWVTKPIADLRDAAIRIGDGELEARADQDEGPPEVRELAEAFNTTAIRLEQLVTAQEQFVADASHQLRTPLTALRLRLEMLEGEEGPAAAEDLDAARNEVLRLSRLVDGLLALARAERATGAAAPPPIRLAEVLDDRRSAWLPVADERDVTLVADLDDTEGRATPDHIGQALDNFVANALEVAPAGSEIRLWTTHGAQPDTVEVHVTDHGPGLTEEQRAHAFDRFWRATTTRSELGGSGLGLAIVQKLVTADGGHAELRETPGGGLDAVLVLQSRS